MLSGSSSPHLLHSDSHGWGQTRPVTYYHLVAKDTIDEKVYHALRERRNAVDAILADIKKNRRRDNE